MASKKSHRWKGCCLMCAAWIRGDGVANRLPVRDLRRLGAKRRITRNGLDHDRDRYAS